MFRSKILLTAIILMLVASSCSPAATSTPEPVQEAAPSGEAAIEAPAAPAPALPDDQPDRELLTVYLDGQAVNESGFTYADLKPLMADHPIYDQYFYAVTIADILGQDIAPIQGAFLEAVDGYVNYVDDVANLYLAAYRDEEGQYKSYELDGKPVYGGFTPGGKVNKGVNKVYLVTTPAAFEVEIQKNGEKIGAITLKEFMQKTDVGGEYVSTAMFDGAYLYNGGADTYSGRFLGISYATMLAKLSEMGMDLSGNIVEVEYYGTNGLNNVGKNFEYATDPGSDKYFGLVDFYCMYDGKTYNSDTANLPVGLTAFINGTGGRWMTMSLTAINFIIQ